MIAIEWIESKIAENIEKINHSYDQFRKKLITFGLDENDLAQIFLNSMEDNKTDLQKFVKEHEIRF